ncbi:MAG: hypothetical protein MZV49_05405 [Rhodopseudomonas palustris]|nr:hypothetical protein [Rhodopseudomonas palustris]
MRGVEAWASSAWPSTATAPSARQPLNTSKTNEGGDKADAATGRPRARGAHQGTRSRDRTSCASKPASRCAVACPKPARPITHKFDIAGHEGYLTVGLFEDGQPGELFITMAKEGSTIGGLMDTIGTLDQPGAPIRRAARSPRQEVRPPALRAERVHQESGCPLRQVHH